MIICEGASKTVCVFLILSKNEDLNSKNPKVFKKFNISYTSDPLDYWKCQILLNAHLA